MDKLNSAPVEIVSDDIDENEILIEKSNLAKQIESLTSIISLQKILSL